MENTEEKKVTPKIKSIVVDTFTGFQKNGILDKWENGKATQDQWKDWGVDMVQFCRTLSDMGFELVLILGDPGTGKSYGMKFLEPKTNIYFNVDNKELTYKGSRQEYGTKLAPTHYMKIPKNYDDVIKTVDKSVKKGSFDERPVAFLVSHTEDYKSGDKMKRRLKTFGNLPNKMGVEDGFTMCYYSEVIMEEGKPVYRFRTFNNGLDTCRSLEQQHDTLYIDNNFQLILDSIQNY